MILEDALEHTITVIAHERNSQGGRDVLTLTGKLKKDLDLYYLDRGIPYPHILLDQQWLNDLIPFDLGLSMLFPNSVYQVTIEVNDIADLYEGNVINPTVLAIH